MFYVTQTASRFFRHPAAFHTQHQTEKCLVWRNKNCCANGANMRKIHTKIFHFMYLQYLPELLNRNLLTGCYFFQFSSLVLLTVSIAVYKLFCFVVLVVPVLVENLWNYRVFSNLWQLQDSQTLCKRRRILSLPLFPLVFEPSGINIHVCPFC
jgi:hypothetical protein